MEQTQHHLRGRKFAVVSHLNNHRFHQLHFSFGRIKLSQLLRKLQTFSVVAVYESPVVRQSILLWIHIQRETHGSGAIGIY